MLEMVAEIALEKLSIVAMQSVPPPRQKHSSHQQQYWPVTAASVSWHGHEMYQHRAMKPSREVVEFAHRVPQLPLHTGTKQMDQDGGSSGGYGLLVRLLNSQASMTIIEPGRNCNPGSWGSMSLLLQWHEIKHSILKALSLLPREKSTMGKVP